LQLFSQRSEPGLEVAPLIESRAIERPVNLLGARAHDGARGFVKLEARGLRLEVAELENALHVRREIRDQLLVLDPQYLSRQDCIPMPHEAHIHVVIPGKVLEAVDEPRSIAGGEELFEVAETAGHRLSARVDDPGIGQNEVNQAQIQKVARPFVDEECLSMTVHERIPDVPFPETPAVFLAELREHAWIIRAAVAARPGGIPEISYEVQDVGQLHCAFHLRMRGQNLLDQSRPCTGQSHDEYRRRIRTSPPLASRKEFPCT